MVFAMFSGCRQPSTFKMASNFCMRQTNERKKKLYVMYDKVNIFRWWHWCDFIVFWTQFLIIVFSYRTFEPDSLSNFPIRLFRSHFLLQVCTVGNHDRRLSSTARRSRHSVQRCLVHLAMGGWLTKCMNNDKERTIFEMSIPYPEHPEQKY